MDNLALTVDKVSRTFGNGFKALKEVSFSVEKGEFLVIGGKNGSGKSLLMNLIAGLDEPTSGKIEVEENTVGLVFQNADAQILGETPEEDILFGLRQLKIPKAQINERITRSLDKTGLLQKRKFPAREMSGGEKRRLAVAGILAMEKELIILDEPFANLDYPGVIQVCNILQELKKSGKTVIVLTHELEKILSLADRFIILNNGEICFNGSPEEGLKLNLEEFGIRNPLVQYKSAEDLFWGRKETY